MMRINSLILYFQLSRQVGPWRPHITCRVISNVSQIMFILRWPWFNRGSFLSSFHSSSIGSRSRPLFLSMFDYRRSQQGMQECQSGSKSNRHSGWLWKCSHDAYHPCSYTCQGKRWKFLYQGFLNFCLLSGPRGSRQGNRQV